MLLQPDDTYYTQLESRALMAGWRRKRPNVWPTPISKFKPTVWRFKDARAALDDSVAFLPPEETERRNLLMVNPFEGNTYPTTSNLIAAYQMVAPGESAPAHRHSPSALRLILQAPRGAVTVVNGREIPMQVGDVVFTPNWYWHSHVNASSEAAYWIDFLDVPLVQHLEAMFFERLSEGEPVPDELDASSRESLRFPTIERLAQAEGDVDVPCAAVPTIAVSAFNISRESPRALKRTTANSIFAVIDGEATLTLEPLDGSNGPPFTAELGRGDVVAVPCWRPGLLQTNSKASLLRVSDEPMLRAAGLLRTA